MSSVSDRTDNVEHEPEERSHKRQMLEAQLHRMDGMNMKLHELKAKKPIYCPWCKCDATDLASFEAKDHPEGGDVTVCMQCGKLAIFLGVGELRRPTHEEAKEYLKIPGVLVAVLIVEATLEAQRKGRRM
jgi:hypothetical protein